MRVISISDEVYLELSKMKNGKSFTALLKSLIQQCENKGDPHKILEFLDTHEALSDESAEKIMAEVAGRQKANDAPKVCLSDIMVVFDTSVLVDAIKKKKAARDLIESYAGRERIATTSISKYEVLRGATEKDANLVSEWLNQFINLRL